jgi:histidine triad (HIT) family protein
MPTDPDCLFCKIIAGEIPSETVYEDDAVVAFRDINPQAPTHILVVPRGHVAKLSDYGTGDEAALGAVLVAARTIAEREGLSDYRTVINCGEGAGQSVWHLHCHLLGGRALRWPPG